jgi:predicted transcriptional regulator
MSDRLPVLGGLEREVMQVVWRCGSVTAELVHKSLSRRLKESTVRTVLRRLEEKGYVRHAVDGRTYVYHAAESRSQVVAKAVQRIADSFYGGALEEVLVAVVNEEGLDLRRLCALVQVRG